MSAYPTHVRLLGAVFYGACSVLIMVINKYILTVWQFPAPNMLALSQFCSTIICLSVLKFFKVISFPDVSLEAAKQVFPLPLFFLMNTLFGLAATKAISIPMFAVLRRFSLLFTMMLEGYMLGTTFSWKIKASIASMLFGAIVAAYGDLAFDAFGYTVILLNDVTTACQGVATKMKLNKSSELPVGGEKSVLGGLGTWGLMFYNAMISAPLLLGFVVMFQSEKVDKVQSFEHWGNMTFMSMFAMSSVMGTILQFSIFYCTKVNSALTVAVTGCLKNVITTLIGMLAPGMDYVFSVLNFAGVTMSLCGAIVYATLKIYGGK